MNPNLLTAGSGKAEESLSATYLKDYLKVLGIRTGSLKSFVMKDIKKSLHKRMPSFPEDVQTFFTDAFEKLENPEK